jgi:predicted transcriptional regulator/SAM-dependent methyltransferase
MTSKELRSRIFIHLDGLVMVPICAALQRGKVLDFIQENNKTSLQILVEKFKANDGYLNVALHALCSQGLLVQTIENDDVRYELTARGRNFLPFISEFQSLIPLMEFAVCDKDQLFSEKHFQLLIPQMEKFKNGFNYTIADDWDSRQLAEHVFTQIEGFFVGPLVVHLGMKGMFHKYFMEKSFRPEEFHEQVDGFTQILNFFTHLGWFIENKGNYQFTDKGLFFARRASAYGVTVSYALMFKHLDELIFGDANYFETIRKGGQEAHVDRAMNVWGSGGAHATYFKVIDEIVMDIFNQPIEKQPKGILDMGCGNGAFLIHLFEVIEQKTLRGKHLDEYPLFLVGADYNEAALKITRANLIQADIWAKVIWGDISNPALLAKDLKDNYDIDLSNLLNVRTFLDHNRVWKAPESALHRKSLGTGAYATKGARISNDVVEANLKEYLTQWKPYVQKYGLLLIELHTINPEIAASNIGKTAVTAYDSTHGFSDQYIIEVDHFVQICSEIGLHPDMKAFRKFPDSELATISINLLRAEI